MMIDALKLVGAVLAVSLLGLGIGLGLMFLLPPCPACGRAPRDCQCGSLDEPHR